MRDIVVLTMVFIGAAAALRHPWLGVMLWTWLSIMNPHRYTYGIALDAPVAAVAAICTMLGFLFTKDEWASPFKSPAVVVFFVFMLWINLSWLNGLGPAADYEQWKKVMKIDIMVLVGLMLLHSKKHQLALVWVVAGSLAVLGAKGGLFTFFGSGDQRVWGPYGTFIEDNNEFGLALVMTIPLLRFLQMQVQSRWGKLALLGVMLLCALAVLGTHSRGGLLAIAAMTVVLWWRGPRRLLNGVLLTVAAVVLVGFMPEIWSNRMDTMEHYQDDGSAQGRLAAWSAAWNMSFHFPTGVGFDTVRQTLFDKYSHNPGAGARAAHSIYFQVLGNHGFIGLGLFVLIWVLTWREAGRLRAHGAKIPQAKWCAELGSMVQVSLVGFLVGGAFLSLAYFDLPYNLMMMVAIARVWVASKSWEREQVEEARWWSLPGLSAQARTH